LRYHTGKVLLYAGIMLLCLVPDGLISICSSENIGEEISYPSISMIYEYDCQLWIYESYFEKSKAITVGTGASLSPCRKKIAYSYNHMLHPHDPLKAKLIGIHVIDLNTWSERKLECKRYSIPQSMPPWETMWSPDGRYILVDSGTGPVREKTVFDSFSGKEIISFDADSNCAWLKCQEIIYTNPIESKDRRRPGEHDYCIAIIDLDGCKRILKEGISGMNYRFVELMENDEIIFEQWSNRGNTDNKAHYYTMDRKGKNLKRIDETEMLSGRIKKTLLDSHIAKEAIRIKEASFVNKGSDWVIFVMNKESISSDADEIYIMNLTKPATLKKIASGRNPLILGKD